MAKALPLVNFKSQQSFYTHAVFLSAATLFVLKHCLLELGCILFLVVGASKEGSVGPPRSKFYKYLT